MARRLLTNTRINWARSRKHDGVMRGTRLPLPVGVAARYAAKLDALVSEMTEATRRELTALFKHEDVQSYFEGFAQDISPASQARILTNQLKARFEQLFGTQAKPLAEGMANQANATSKTAMWSSLKELSGGLSLKTADVLTGPMDEFFTATVAQNVALIKSIPAEYMLKVQGEVLRSITDGKGLADLVPFLEDQAGVTSRRAKNIALDQTHKAYNGLNVGRMKAIGVKQFEWLHSGGGQHPRPMHIALSGQIFSFDKLPVIDEDGTRGIPGQAINCRCTMLPVIKFDEGEQA